MFKKSFLEELRRKPDELKTKPFKPDCFPQTNTACDLGEVSDIPLEAEERSLQRGDKYMGPPCHPKKKELVISTKSLDIAKADPLDHDGKYSSIQSEHDWDTIVDTCFSGSEVPVRIGAQPQDWIFDFDSPVPAPESHDRHLNVGTRYHEMTSNNPNQATFYGTIGSNDFAL